MKPGFGVILVALITVFVSCSGNVRQTSPVLSPATNSSPASTNMAMEDDYATAFEEFTNVRMDIPFSLRSSDLKLDDSGYYIKNQSIESFMKRSLIPALAKVVKTLPSGKMVVINGYASKTSTEEPSKDFIGNIALSKNRAQVVLDYMLKNTNWDASKFKIKFYGSSIPLPGLDPVNIKNCRVSIDIE